MLSQQLEEKGILLGFLGKNPATSSPPKKKNGAAAVFLKGGRGGILEKGGRGIFF